MTLEDIDRLYSNEEVIQFTQLFRGTFFCIHLGDPVYGNKNGCYKLKDYESTLELVKESIKEKRDLLEINLDVEKGQNT